MDRLLMKKLEMAARVAEFQRAHPYTDRNQAAVGRRFEARLAEAQSLFSREHEERLAHRAETQHRQALQRDLVATMRSVVRIAQLAAGGDPRLASRFKPVKSSSNVAFVAQSKSLLEVATENQDTLIRGGLLRSQLAAFASGLAEFQKVMAAIVVIRRKLNETRTALRSAMADLAKLVRVLDVFQTARFAGDTSLLAARPSKSPRKTRQMLRRRCCRSRRTVVGTPRCRVMVGRAMRREAFRPARDNGPRASRARGHGSGTKDRRIENPNE